MSTAMHPAAPHHLPAFITAPGETDPFMVGAAIFLVIMVLAAGSLYFRLHALPEHLAHRNASKLQFEVVAILSLLALFTHNSTFWVAALLLALVPIPNLHGPLTVMADSLAKMAGWRKAPAGSGTVAEGSAAAADAGAAAAMHGPAVSGPAGETPRAAATEAAPESSGASHAGPPPAPERA
jgi:hypothetical protein